MNCCEVRKGGGGGGGGDDDKMAKLADIEHSCVLSDVGQRWTEMCSDIVSVA